MKGIISLAVLCLLACSAVNAGNNSNQGHLSRQKRATTDTCSISCVQGGGSVSTSKSWVIVIESVIYIYNNENNFFGVVNLKLNFAFLIVGDSGLLAIINTKTGFVILIDIKTSKAILINGTGPIIGFDSQTTVYAAFEVVFTLVLQKKGDLTGTSTFDFLALIIFISTKVDVTGAAFLNGNATLGAALNTNFGVLFQLTNSLIVSGVVNVSLGISVIISGVINLSVGARATISSIFFLINSIIIRLNGVFTADLFIQLKIVVTTAQSGILEDITKLGNAVYAVGIYYIDLKSALDAYAANKFITSLHITYVVIGTVTYKITTFIDSSNNWVFEIVSGVSSVLISYNSDKNFISIYNKDLNYAFIVVGNVGLVAVYNLAVGVGIVSKGANAVYVTTNAAAIKALAVKGDFSGAITAAAAVVLVTSVPLIGSNSFSIVSFYLAISTGFGFDAVFLFKNDLKQNIQTNFSALISGFKGTYYSATSNGFAAITFIFGKVQLSVVINGFISLFGAIYSGLSGFFDTNFGAVLYVQIDLSVSLKFSGGFLTNLCGLLAKQVAQTFDGAKSAFAQLQGGLQVSIGG